MSAFAHVASQEVALTGSNYTTVVIVAIIALAALGVAAVLVRQVLAADEGTDSMKKIALAIQEGASAYLNRQFRTLAIFAVLVFFLLCLIDRPHSCSRISLSDTSCFFSKSGKLLLFLVCRSFLHSNGSSQ